MEEDREAIANSATPILESGVLPPRIRKVKLGGLITGFLMGLTPAILLIIIGREANNELAPGLDLLSFFFVLVLATIVHELGHLSAGWIVGFRFSLVQIGPVSLRIEHGILRVRVRREMTALGYAGMHVNRLPRLRRRLLVYIAAGPAANLLSVPIAVFVVNYAFTGLRKTWVATPAVQFVVISILLGITSLARISSVSMSDGSRIAMLSNSRDRTRRWLSMIALGQVHSKGTRPRQWKSTWLRAATSLTDLSHDTFRANLLAYMSASDRKDASEAGNYLEKCLELAGTLPRSVRDFLAQESAVFAGWFRDNASLSDKWFAQVQKPKLMSRLSQIRILVARECAHRDFEGAMLGWQEGLAFIDRATAGTAQTQLKQGWLEWQSEILERKTRHEVEGPSMNLPSVPV